jgi:hypothetical protein
LCELWSFSSDHWVAVLRLATRWELWDYRKVAINYLTNVFNNDGFRVQGITFGKDYSVAGWVRSGYEALVKRVNCITLEEAKALGIETMTRICNLRETYIRANHSYTLDQLVEQAFKNELSEISRKEVLMTPGRMEVMTADPETEDKTPKKSKKKK